MNMKKRYTEWQRVSEKNEGNDDDDGKRVYCKRCDCAVTYEDDIGETQQAKCETGTDTLTHKIA